MAKRRSPARARKPAARSRPRARGAPAARARRRTAAKISPARLRAASASAPRARRAPREPRAPAKPRADGALSQAEYARRRGVSREAVSKAIRDGRIRLDERGRLDPVAADAAWRANTDPGRPGSNSAAASDAPGDPPTPSPAALAAAAAGATTLPEGMTYAEARALREWNQALMVDLQRRQLDGKLVEIAKVDDAAFRAARTVRDLLMALPDRLDAELAATNDPNEVHRRLEDELRRICDELSLGLRQDPDVEDLAS